VAINKLPQLRKRPVRREIPINNGPDNRLRLFNHGGTRKNAHSADQRLDADECRYFRLIVHEGVSVQLGCFVDELLVELLSRGLVLREPCGPILAPLREPSRGERRQTADR
jgi:hypothetical protein